MKICRYCGNRMYDNETYCNNCGRHAYEHYVRAGSYDRGGCGWTLLGFLQPIIGLVLYLVWRDEKPITARSAGKGALICVIMGIIFFIIYLLTIILFVPFFHYLFINNNSICTV